MSLNLPVVERITQNIVTTLQAITAGNTYAFTVSAVYRMKPNIEDVKVGDLVIHIDLGEHKPDTEHMPVGFDRWIQRYKIHGICIDSATGTDPGFQRLNKFRADVIRALSADWQRGGLALFQSFVNDDKAEPYQGNDDEFLINLDVVYRTKLGDPNKLIGE